MSSMPRCPEIDRRAFSTLQHRALRSVTRDILACRTCTREKLLLAGKGNQLGETATTKRMTSRRRKTETPKRVSTSATRRARVVWTTQRVSVSTTRANMRADEIAAWQAAGTQGANRTGNEQTNRRLVLDERSES